MPVPIPSMRLIGKKECECCGIYSEPAFSYGGQVLCIKCDILRMQKNINRAKSLILMVCLPAIVGVIAVAAMVAEL